MTLPISQNGHIHALGGNWAIFLTRQSHRDASEAERSAESRKILGQVHVHGQNFNGRGLFLVEFPFASEKTSIEETGLI